jgi:hypothetical protein
VKTEIGQGVMCIMLLAFISLTKVVAANLRFTESRSGREGNGSTVFIPLFTSMISDFLKYPF